MSETEPTDEDFGAMKGGISLLWWMINLALSAWVFWKLWRWFGIPAGAPKIGFWHAAGIWIGARYVTVTRGGRHNDEWWEGRIRSTAFSLLVLLLGRLFQLGVAG